MAARFAIVVSPAAEDDLHELHDFIAEHDAPAKADHVVDRIADLISTLQSFPERGPVTKELAAIGVKRFRETYFKPYRVVYSIEGSEVHVHLIADGRRDMQTLLQKRLLRP